MTRDHDLERIDRLLELNRDTEAEAAARDYLTNDPDSVEALCLLSQALRHQDREAEAVEVARSAVSLDPRSMDARLELCDALTLLERGEEAAAAARSLVADRPDWWVAHYAHARALLAFRHPRIRDALNSLDVAISLHPHESSLHALAGVLLKALNQPDRAGEALRTALRIDPQNTMAMTALADLEGGIFRLGGAASNVRSALSVDAQNAFVHGGLNTLAWRLGRRLVIALVLAGLLVGIEVVSEAATWVRAGTGVVTLALCGWLVRMSLQQLPRGMARSPRALWGGVDFWAKSMLVVCVLLTVVLCGMAFTPLDLARSSGSSFLAIARGLMIAMVLTAVVGAFRSLFSRQE